MNKPYNFFLAIFAISTILASTACKYGRGKSAKPIGNMICDKSGREIFYDCLIKNVPLDSNYEKLNKFLVIHGFSSSNLTPATDGEYKFYFIWNSNNLANYKIGVIGRTNSDLEIIDMKMI